MHTNPSHSFSSKARKIVVIGGTGLIGKPLVAQLRAQSHQVVAASPSQGINAVTGEGLDAALSGAHTVIDVSNSPSFEDAAVLDFFTRSTNNLISSAKKSGVQHILALSVVGADRLPDSGYLRAKVAQEKIIRDSGLPFTIVRATQFFEFAGAIAHSVTVNGEVRVPIANMQPIAAADVSALLANLSLAAPLNNIIEIAGPEKLSQAEFLRRELSAAGDARPVVIDAKVGYFGAKLGVDTLVPAFANPILASTRQTDWLKAKTPAIAAR